MHRRLRRIFNIYLNYERDGKGIGVTATIFLFNDTRLRTDHVALGWLWLLARETKHQARQQKDKYHWHWKHALITLMECAEFVAASSTS